MGYRDILQLEPDERRLRMVSREVKGIDKRILMLLDDMKETMYTAEGAGLAAPQVGVLRRVVVIDVGDGLIELINPKIIKISGSNIEQEGCLSIPEEMRGYVKRPEIVKVQAVDRHGDVKEYTGSGYTARAFCHEIDHLNGVLFIDKVIKGYKPKEEKPKK
ncbi:MAG: peptide deformylase [Eubacteriales bacterium]